MYGNARSDLFGGNDFSTYKVTGLQVQLDVHDSAIATHVPDVHIAMREEVAQWINDELVFVQV